MSSTSSGSASGKALVRTLVGITHSPSEASFLRLIRHFSWLRGISLIVAGMSLTILAVSSSSPVLWQSKWVLVPRCPRPHAQSLVLLWETSVWNTIWLWVALQVKPPRTLEKRYQKTFDFRISGGSETWLLKVKGKTESSVSKGSLCRCERRHCILLLPLPIFFSFSCLFLELQVCWTFDSSSKDNNTVHFFLSLLHVE